MATQHPLRYQHRVVTVGGDWYIDVQILSMQSHTTPADLLPILSVKHGWRPDRIAIVGIESPPFIAGGIGPKLRKAHEAAQHGEFRNDIKVVVPYSPGELWGNEPLVRE